VEGEAGDRPAGHQDRLAEREDDEELAALVEVSTRDGRPVLGGRPAEAWAEVAERRPTYSTATAASQRPSRASSSTSAPATHSTPAELDHRKMRWKFRRRLGSSRAWTITKTFLSTARTA
jgi:hypothetical protein